MSHSQYQSPPGGDCLLDPEHSTPSLSRHSHPALPAAAASLLSALSYVLSGYDGLYSSQRILYDKLKAQYIDVHTNAHHEGQHTPMEEKYR